MHATAESQVGVGAHLSIGSDAGSYIGICQSGAVELQVSEVRKPHQGFVVESDPAHGTTGISMAVDDLFDGALRSQQWNSGHPSL